MNFNSISEGFGLRFKTILNKNKVKQSQFSRDTETNPSLVSRYVNGESPSGDFIIKAVAYFPEDVHFLFFGNSADTVAENSAQYVKSPAKLINEIEERLENLKRVLAQ